MMRIRTFALKLTTNILIVNIISSLALYSLAAYFLQSELQTRFIRDARSNSAMIISMVGRENSIDEPQIIESLLEEALRNKHVSYAVLSHKTNDIVPPLLLGKQHVQSKQDLEFGEGGDNIFHFNLPVALGDSREIGKLHLDYDETPTKNDIRLVYMLTTGLALLYLLITSILSNMMIKTSIRPIQRLSDIANSIADGKQEESFLDDSNIEEFRTVGVDLEAMRLSLNTQRDKIRENEKHVRSIINNMAEGVVTFEQNGNISSANDKARFMFGIDLDLELEGASISINNFLYGVNEQGGKVSGFVLENLDNLITKVNHELIAVNVARAEFAVGVALMRVDLGYGNIYIANVRDITANKETEKKILDAQQQAERANMAKSEFLSRMSHELRTPMNAIIGFSELLHTDDEHPLNDQQARDVNRILVSAKHLLELINEVLDISQVESGKLELLNENVCVTSIINESVEMIQPLLERSKLSVRMAETDVDYLVFADKIRLKQILINVMSNAAKYNRRNGSITILIKLCPANQLEISISDTGIGISKDNMGRMFEPFTRFSEEQTTVEGTGIGLSITKRLLQAMGGSINVRSKVGVGTTVSIQIGLSDVSASISSKKISQIKPTNVKTLAQSQHLFLYIEDNPVNLEIVNRILVRIGNYRLLSSPSSELGVALAGSNSPNIIMINLDIPGLNAIVAYRIMRKHPQTMNTPIVAICSDNSAKQALMAKNQGFDAYVTSPINTILLEQIIHDLRSGHGNDESRFRAINS